MIPSDKTQGGILDGEYDNVTPRTVQKYVENFGFGNGGLKPNSVVQKHSDHFNELQSNDLGFPNSPNSLSQTHSYPEVTVTEPDSGMYSSHDSNTRSKSMDKPSSRPRRNKKDLRVNIPEKPPSKEEFPQPLRTPGALVCCCAKF